MKYIFLDSDFLMDADTARELLSEPREMLHKLGMGVIRNDYGCLKRMNRLTGSFWIITRIRMLHFFCRRTGFQ